MSWQTCGFATMTSGVAFDFDDESSLTSRSCRSPMANLSPANLRPRIGDCLYSEHYLLLNAEDFAEGAIRWVSLAPSSEHTAADWRGIVCSRCEGMLGEALVGSQSLENSKEKEQSDSLMPSSIKQRGNSTKRSRIHSKRASSEDNAPQSSPWDSMLAENSSLVEAQALVPGLDLTNSSTEPVSPMGGHLLLVDMWNREV
eukprot:15796-Hanusia_phi.AAC.1